MNRIRMAAGLLVACALAMSIGAVLSADEGKPVVPVIAASKPAAASAPADKKLADIRRLMELNGAANRSEQIIRSWIADMKKTAPEVPAEFWDEFTKEVKPADLAELVVGVYDRHFTHDEIKAMIAFYESPAGRKLQAEMPAITKESMEAGRKWAEQLARGVLKKQLDRRDLDAVTTPATAPSPATAPADGEKKKAAERQITGVLQALDRYRQDIGSYPAEDEGGIKALLARPTYENSKLGPRWAGPYIKEAELKDAWGHDVIYKLVESETKGEFIKVPHVWSIGPNGKDEQGDGDDIKSWTDYTGN